tara:strand:- start:355 stop:468 length:114 start_codon:yes stop_codon:yes gene_type:complete
VGGKTKQYNYVSHKNPHNIATFCTETLTEKYKEFSAT